MTPTTIFFVTFFAGLAGIMGLYRFVRWLWRPQPPKTGEALKGDTVLIGANIPEPTWEWSLDPKFWISMRPPGEPPAWPHRIAQRVVLGIRWRPICRTPHDPTKP
jgi:hypothetical protein